MTGADDQSPEDSLPLEAENRFNAEADRTESLSWSVRLSDGAPAKRFVIIGVAVGAAALGLIVFKSILLALAGFVMILGSAAEHVFGAKFAVDAKGATARVGLSVVSMTWSEVKRVFFDGPYVVLSPFAEKSKMDTFRGVRLRVTNENRSTVLELIRKNCGENVRLLGD